jgi:hypothetical protein
MKLKRRDYLLLLLSRRLAPLLKEFGVLESDILRRRLSPLPIDRPVFITGLARSGTTLLLNLLAKVAGVATHRFRDFPVLWTPLAWNWFHGRAATAEAAVERSHRDRIKITKESPEAFEEPLRQSFFPDAHDETASHFSTILSRRRSSRPSRGITFAPLRIGSSAPADQPVASPWGRVLEAWRRGDDYRGGRRGCTATCGGFARTGSSLLGGSTSSI